jgi:hypothetical protein
MKKRLAVIILALVMALGVMSLATASTSTSATALSITGGSTLYAVNESTTLTVSTNTELAGLTFTVTYDPSFLTLDTVTPKKGSIETNEGYSWYSSEDNVTGDLFTLTFTRTANAVEGEEYDVTVTPTSATKVDTDAENAGADIPAAVTAQVSVKAPIVITAQPTSGQTVTFGETYTASVAALSYVSNGTGTEALSYQWYYTNNNNLPISSWTRLTNATSATLSTSALPVGEWYVACHITCKTYTLDSNEVTVTVTKAAPTTPTATVDGGTLHINNSASGSVQLSEIKSVFEAQNPNPGTVTITDATSADPLNVTHTANSVTYTLKDSAQADKTYYITVTVSSDNYTEGTVTVAVQSKDKDPIEVKFTTATGSVTYTGKVQTFEKAKVTGKNLKGKIEYTYETEDGTLSNGEPYGAGTYTVTATYEDTTYFGTATATFTIKKASLKLGTVKVAAKEYDATTNIDPKDVTVSLTGLVGADKSKKLQVNTDYTVTAYYTSAKVGSPDAVVTVALSDALSKNYTLTGGENKTVKSSITQRSANVSISAIADQPYQAGASVELGEDLPLVVSNLMSGDKLVEGQDYVVKYKNNKNAGTATVTVSPNGKKGNYTFKACSQTFKIIPSTLSEGQFSYKVNDVTITYLTTPTNKLLKGTVTLPDGKTTIKGTWSWVDAAAVAKLDSGTHTAEVKFTSSNKNIALADDVKLYVTVNVKGAALTITGAEVSAREYDKNDDSATITKVTFKSGKQVVELEKDKDYTVTGKFTKNAVGDKQNVSFTVTLIKTDNSAAKNFELTKATSTTKGKITGKHVQVTVTVNNGEDVQYNGKVQKPSVAVTYKDESGATVTIDSKQYKVTYPKSKSGSNLVVTVTPVSKSNFYFVDANDKELKSVTGTFSITKGKPQISLKKTEITTTYTGVKPADKLLSGTATVNGTKVNGTFSFVDPEKYINAGTYTATVLFTPKEKDGYETATTEVKLTVNPAVISVSKIKIDNISLADLESGKKPTVTVTFKGLKNKETLVLDDDYSVDLDFTPAKGSQKVKYTVNLHTIVGNYTFKGNADEVTGSTTIKIT